MATELLKRCLQHNRVGFLLYIELESIGIHFNNFFQILSFLIQSYFTVLLQGT